MFLILSEDSNACPWKRTSHRIKADFPGKLLFSLFGDIVPLPGTKEAIV